MRYFINIITLTCLLCVIGKAQQDPMYSMYVVDKMLINPAFAGSSNWIVATAKNREALSGFGTRFSTQTFNFHAPIQLKHMGIGLKFINDNRVLINNQNLAVDVSYHLNFAGGKLSLGLEGGIYKRRIKYDDVTLQNWNDPVFVGNTASTIPDFSFGAYYQKKQFYCGVSRMHLVRTKIDKKVNPQTGSILTPHHYILVGNIFDLSKHWAAEVSTLVKKPAGASFQMDVNSMITYNERVSVGLQYRTGDAISAMMKFHITDNLRISYAYDHSLSKLAKYTNGAHEIVVSYGVLLPPPPLRREIHPRYYF